MARTAPPLPPLEELRALRALSVLERIDTPEARKILEEQAQRPSSSAPLRTAAQAALARLAKTQP